MDQKGGLRGSEDEGIDLSLAGVEAGGGLDGENKVSKKGVPYPLSYPSIVIWLS